MENINQQFEEWWKVYGEYLSPMAKNVARSAYRAGYEAAQQSVQRTAVQACGCPVGVIHTGDGSAPCGL